MQPVHAHELPQPILGFISIDVFFHTEGICGSKLRERMEIIVLVPASFSVTYFWVQQGSYSIGIKLTDKQTQNALYIHIESEIFSSYFSPFLLKVLI